MDKLQDWLDGGKVRRFEELVSSNQVYKNILESAAQNETGGDGMDETDGSIPPNDNPDGVPEFLYESIKKGCLSIFYSVLGNKVDVSTLPTKDGVTVLHIAAEYASYEDMKILLDAGAEVKRDGKGLTPLHLAALSTEPNPMTARLLVEHISNKDAKERHDLINARIPYSKEDKSDNKRGNTALHFAAGNEQISREFIESLEVIDPSIMNEKDETAFHIAARAADFDVIVSMLEMFISTGKGWKLKDIDAPNHGSEENKKKQTLLETCSRRGNAKAVALLIKFGADISETVLFGLLDESVNNPTQTDNLISVYRTIKDKCVFWKWLKSSKVERQSYPTREQKVAYAENQREIMLKFLNTRSKSDKNRNVLEHAVIIGADVFLREILNTIFKITPENESDDVKYDVTDFLIARGRSQEPYCRCLRRRVSPDSESSPSSEEHSAPKKPYLYLITDSDSGTGDFWKYTDILQVEPFLTITQPICGFVKFFYLAMTLLQFLYMFGFSADFLPPYCTLGDMFNPFRSSVPSRGTL